MALFIDKLEIFGPTVSLLGPIPDTHVADGGNTAPRLSIAGAPVGTVEFAVICHDPDAPLPRGFTHWVVYGVPAAAEVVDVTVEGVRIGPNSLGDPMWFGPQPPVGHGVHHYYFWVFALSRRVLGEPTREAFLDEYADAIIEQARLVGTFER